MQGGPVAKEIFTRGFIPVHSRTTRVLHKIVTSHEVSYGMRRQKKTNFRCNTRGITLYHSALQPGLRVAGCRFCALPPAMAALSAAAGGTEWSRGSARNRPIPGQAGPERRGTPWHALARPAALITGRPSSAALPGLAPNSTARSATMAPPRRVAAVPGLGLSAGCRRVASRCVAAPPLGGGLGLHVSVAGHATAKVVP